MVTKYRMKRSKLLFRVHLRLICSLNIINDTIKNLKDIMQMNLKFVKMVKIKKYITNLAETILKFL